MAQGIVLIIAGIAVAGWTAFGGLGAAISRAIIGGDDTPDADSFGNGSGGGGGGAW